MSYPNRTASQLRLRLATPIAVVLALVVVMCSGASISAATTMSGAPLPHLATNFPATSEEEWEWEEEGEEEWEWEQVDEEDEEDGGEWEEDSSGGGSNEAPEACQLYETHARVVASDRGDSVRLVIRYASTEASRVEVEYWLKGSKGALQLKPLRGHMSKHGSLRGVERLGVREMEKVRAARVFVVDIELPGTPTNCERYRTRHLTARLPHGARTTWSEAPLGTQPLTRRTFDLAQG